MLPHLLDRRRRATTLVTSAAIAGLLLPALGFAAPAVAAPAALPAPATAVPSGPCPDEDGVTVVVDLTDLGGEVAVGCAPGDPASGTAALTAAGFTEARDGAGMICAVAGQPDPCPATFEGQYWSYWSGEPGGEWTSYSVGSDQSDPAPGTVEGWRYFDGSAGPTIDPPAPGTAGSGDAEEPARADATDETADEAAGGAEDGADATAGSDAGADDGSGTSPAPFLVALAAVAVVATAGVVAARRRRDGNGPAGQH